MIGAFGDDLETQLQVLKELKIPCLELRAAWGVNVLNLSDEQVTRLDTRLTVHTLGISINRLLGVHDSLQIEKLAFPN